MQDLAAKVAAAAGIDASKAELAIGVILGFLRKEAGSQEVEKLIDALPGAETYIAESGYQGGSAASLGGFGGLTGFGGGGLMGLASKLQEIGLGMGEMQAVGKTLFAHAREIGDEELVGQITSSVPGLSQFV